MQGASFMRALHFFFASSLIFIKKKIAYNKYVYICGK